jgi:hypothetical protein
MDMGPVTEDDAPSPMLVVWLVVGVCMALGVAGTLAVQALIGWLH